MRIKFSFLFITLASILNAQISGYMGKRFVVGYSTYFMPVFRGPGAFSSAAADENSPTINNAHCLNLEYVYKTNKMICVSAQYILTGLAYDNGKTNATIAADFFNSPRELPYPQSHVYLGGYSKPASLSSINFDIGYKKFRRGYLAPVGKYIKYDFVFLMETLKYDYQKFGAIDPSSSSYPPTYIQSDLGTGHYSFKTIAIACTFGNEKVLNDKITLDYGIRFAYSPSLNIITLTNGDSNSASIYNYFRRSCNLRMAREQLINIHLGIGFLAF
jgi:hypothetical protein